MPHRGNPAGQETGTRDFASLPEDR